MKNTKHKALKAKKSPRKDSGHYVSPQGIRYLSRKESAEKTKNWPIMQKNFKPKGTFQELAFSHFRNKK